MTNRNLEHSREGMCQDPDCELHYIEVAVAERVVSATDVAFFLAGAARMAQFLKVEESTWWEFIRTIERMPDPGDHYDSDRPPGTSGSWGEA